MTTDRFDGTVAWLCPVEADDLIAWIIAIPFTDWPQQHPDNGMRPAMVNDPAWHDLWPRTHLLVAEVLEHFPACHDANRMLSVVMPGHTIPEHADQQAPDWVTRVHVPLTSNTRSGLGMPDGAWWLQPGQAYRVNTEVPHSIWNYGETPRVHFMCDVFHA